MPLQYDDVPGSWDTFSKHWPYIKCSTEEQALRAYVACSLEGIVPYGSYVQVGLELRIETTELCNKLRKHLDSTLLKTTEDVQKWHKEKQACI